LFGEDNSAPDDSDRKHDSRVIEGSIPGPGIESAAQLLGRVLVAALESERQRRTALNRGRKQGRSDVFRLLAVPSNTDDRATETEADDTLPPLHQQRTQNELYGSQQSFSKPETSNHSQSLQSSELEEEGDDMLQVQARRIAEQIQQGHEAMEALDIEKEKNRVLQDSVVALRARLAEVVQASQRNSGRVPSGTIGPGDTELLETASRALEFAGSEAPNFEPTSQHSPVPQENAEQPLAPEGSSPNMNALSHSSLLKGTVRSVGKALSLASAARKPVASEDQSSQAIQSARKRRESLGHASLGSMGVGKGIRRLSFDGSVTRRALSPEPGR